MTDIKQNNLPALERIAKKLKGFADRIIPQIYFPHNYEAVKKLGYKQVIWTLYRYKDNQDDVLNTLDKLKGLYALTIPSHRVEKEFLASLKEKGIYTYTHTINDEQKVKYFKSQGVDEVYTDFLNP